MESETFLSTDNRNDLKFVQAIEELMGSLPEKVVCRISNFSKDSSGVNSNLSKNEIKLLCSEDRKLVHYEDNGGSISGLVEQFRSSRAEENLKENSQDVYNTIKVAEEYTMNDQIPVKPLISDTYYLLSNVTPPHQSKDFRLKPITKDVSSLGKMVDVNGCVEEILKTSLKFQHVSDDNGDLLIADALVEVEGDFEAIDKILQQGGENSNKFDEQSIKAMHSRQVKFASSHNKHVGSGDCSVAPLKTLVGSQELNTGELGNARMNTFNVLTEEQAQYSTMNFSSMNEKPLKTHWALTRIAYYEDAYTYEVMRPFKKAPKKVPKEADKVFIVIKGKEK